MEQRRLYVLFVGVLLLVVFLNLREPVTATFSTFAIGERHHALEEQFFAPLAKPVCCKLLIESTVEVGVFLVHND